MSRISKRAMRRAVALASCVGALAACSSGSGSGGGTSTTTSSVSKAEKQVKAAESTVASAAKAFESASKKFCSSSQDLIETLDRYGKVLDDDAVTVGDIQTGGADLRFANTTAKSSAQDAVNAHEDVLKANDELAKAKAELQAAQEQQTTGSTSPSTTTSTTIPLPLVPNGTVERVHQAEEDLVSAGKGVVSTTPIREAGVKLHSAAFALEIAWIQVVAGAGCLTNEQEALAFQQVVAYTKALQTDLAAAGYSTGTVDGIYGPTTVAAVEQLQKDAGLPVTGLPDGPTQRALDAKVQQKDSQAAAAASNRNAAIQGALKVLGYWDGPIDGQWSDALGEAIKKLQTDLGVPVTGAVDTVTLQALEQKLASTKALVENSSTTTSSTTTTPPAS